MCSFFCSVTHAGPDQCQVLQKAISSNPKACTLYKSARLFPCQVSKDEIALGGYVYIFFRSVISLPLHVSDSFTSCVQFLSPPFPVSSQTLDLSWLSKKQHIHTALKLFPRRTLQRSDLAVDQILVCTKYAVWKCSARPL